MSERLLLIDPFAGIAGNMFVAACLDMGVERNLLTQNLALFGITENDMIFEPRLSKGVRGTYFNIHDEPHHHHHHHGDAHHAHGRSFKEIRALIEGSGLPSPVVQDAVGIFTLLAEAEGKIHGIQADDVHFHEVGEKDSIADIVGAALCVFALAPSEILSYPVNVGSGFIECAHGTYPVPAPATVELLKGMPVFAEGDFERTTPTGAAILRHYVTRFPDPAKQKIPYRVEKTGYGIGSRATGEMPNALRLFLMEKSRPEQTTVLEEELIEIETTIDDMNPQLYERAIDLCFEAGALDVTLTPVSMKKSRPGTVLSVLCSPEDAEGIREILFTHTTTLGIRQKRVERFSLKREMREVETKYGTIPVKIAHLPKGGVKAHPEYGPCAEISKRTGLPLSEIFAAALSAL